MNSETDALLKEILAALKAAKPAREIMSTPEASEYLGCSESFLRELIAVYRIPFSRIPGADGSRGRIVLRRKVLDVWLESKQVNSAADDRRLLDGRRRVA